MKRKIKASFYVKEVSEQENSQSKPLDVCLLVIIVLI